MIHTSCIVNKKKEKKNNYASFIHKSRSLNAIKGVRVWDKKGGKTGKFECSHNLMFLKFVNPKQMEKNLFRRIFTFKNVQSTQFLFNVNKYKHKGNL